MAAAARLWIAAVLCAGGLVVLVWCTRPPDADAVRTALLASGDPVDLAAAGEPVLLDPRAALPETRAALRLALRDLAAFATHCGEPPVVPAALAKALVWHRAACGQVQLPAGFFASGPPMHPSGRSFAALARADGRPIAGPLHALEQPGALGDLGPDGLDAVRRGVAVYVAPAFLWLRTRSGRGPGGLPAYRVVPRERAEAVLSAANAVLAPGETCAAPLVPGAGWCLTPRLGRAVLAGAVGALALGAVVAALATARARRRATRVAQDRERLVIRTLTHELRTPATAIGLAVEPLRSRFDGLPDDAQDAVLRLADQSARLQRVLATTARWLRTTEAPGGDGGCAGPVPSLHAAVRAGLAGLDDEVAVHTEGDDRPGSLDAGALEVCVSNLVANALHHGRAPVTVRVTVGRRTLRVAVADGGSTPDDALVRFVQPFVRGDASRGLGLGLSLVDRLTRRMGGRLTHRGAPTTFTVEIPA